MWWCGGGGVSTRSRQATQTTRFNVFWAGLAGLTRAEEEEGNSDLAISFSRVVGLVISVRGMNKQGGGEDLSWQREEGGGGVFVRGVWWKIVVRSGRNGWGLGITTACSVPFR